jgi:hypothetical protein
MGEKKGKREKMVKKEEIEWLSEREDLELGFPHY